jgi:1,4-alpha-glucan branching enzyme
MNNKNHDPGKVAGPKLVPIRFESTHPTAQTVSIAGSFNHWEADAKARHPSGGGRWLKETALKPGTYEYCLVVDGQWMPDPQALETVSNPFGGRNSVLRVAITPEATHLTEAEHVPLKNANKQKAIIL